MLFMWKADFRDPSFSSNPAPAHLQAHQVDELVEVLLVAGDVLQAEVHLFVLRLEPGRQQTVYSQPLALLKGERHALWRRGWSEQYR